MTETVVLPSDAAASLGLLDRIAEFLRSVTPQDLSDLSKGRAWISIGRAGEYPRRKPTRRKAFTSGSIEAPPSPKTEEVITTLRATESSERGLAYLEALNLGKGELQSVLKELRQKGYSKDNMAILRAKIIRVTIGAPGQSAALQGL